MNKLIASNLSMSYSSANHKLKFLMMYHSLSLKVPVLGLLDHLEVERLLFYKFLRALKLLLRGAFFIMILIYLKIA